MADKTKVRHIDADAEAQKHLADQLERAKTERAPEILTALLFALFVAAFAISFWIVPDRDFSENENRTLAKMPAITVNSLTAKEDRGKFTSKFAKYMADQFPLRDAFVVVKGTAELALGKRENNGVFILGDTLAERFDDVDAANVEKNAASVDRFLAACEDRGVTAKFAVFGRAMDMTDLPIYGSDATDTAWAKLDGHDFVDMRAALEGHRDEYVYYRTDHHHTTLGAYYAYRYLAPLLGYEANDVSHYSREIASDEFFGTTWSKAGVRRITPDTIEYFRWDGDEDETVTLHGSSGNEASVESEVDPATGSQYYYIWDDDNDAAASVTQTVHTGMYFTEHLGEKDKYASFLESATVGRVDVTSPGGAKPKLLVIKDSFAHSLVPFLAEHYDVTMIDPRYYNQPVIDLVDGEGFDAVLVCCNMASLSTAPDFYKLRMGLDK